MKSRLVLSGYFSTARLLAAGAAIAGAGAAGAVDFDWIGGDEGYFGSAFEWSPAGGPPNSAADSATFNTATDIDVSFDLTATTFEPTLWINERLTVERGEVALSLLDFTNILDPPRGVTYRLEPGGVVPIAVRVGTVAGQTATLQVLGDDGTDATIEAIGIVQVGIVAGATGELVIGSPFDPGARAFFQTTSLLQVGVAGAGEVMVADSVLTSVGASLGGLTGASGLIELGGSLANTATWSNVGDVTMGLQAGASGEVRLDDYTTWTNTGSVYLGGSSTAGAGTGLIQINFSADDALADIGGDLVLYSGGSVALFGGTLLVDGQVTSTGAASIDLSGGVLAVEATQFLAQSALNWTSGTFRATGAMKVEGGGVFGSTLQVDGTRTLEVVGQLSVGTQSAGSLTIDAGGTLAGSSVQVGNQGAGAGGGTLTIDGAGTSAGLTGDLTVGGTGTAGLMVTGGGTFTQADAFLAPAAGTGAEARVSGAGSDWQGNNYYLGGDAAQQGGTGTLLIDSGANVAGTGVLRVWGGYAVTVDGGSLALPEFDIRGLLLVQNGGAVQTQGGAFDVVGGSAVFVSGSTLNIEQSAATVTQGATLSGAVEADAASTLAVADAGSVWATTQHVVLGGGGTGTNELGVLTVGVGGTVSVDTLALAGAGGLEMTGGTVMASSIALGSHGLTGNGTLQGQVSSSGAITANGALTIGDASDPAALQLDGPLNVGAHTVTLLRQGFFTAGNSVTIAGGTLAAPGGVAVPTGSVVLAHGAVQAPTVVIAGATLGTTGHLSVGDSAALNGFYGNGVFDVADGTTLTLLDANQAVLDAASLVQLQGNGSALAAANGLAINFGGAVTGRGTVQTPDDPFSPLINNGAIVGESAANPITLTGYIKGVGTLDHVVITGTDAPGLSPATVYRGNVSYQGTLEIELAGTGDGEFDRAIHSGQADLGGVLDLALADGFAPLLGDRFQIIDAQTLAGTFNSVTGQHLAGGLSLALHYDTIGVELSVELTGDYSDDGYVGADDLDILLARWGDTVTPGDYAVGDGSGNGLIDDADLQLVLANFGNGTIPGGNVPEPGSAALLVVGGLARLRRRRA